MKIYLDNCALGRLFDSQDQLRLRAEADAVGKALELVQQGAMQWISSSALEQEVAGNRDIVRRQNTQAVLSLATTVLQFHPAIASRAHLFQSHGFSNMDAWHLAFAEAGEASALLTTDDRLIQRVERLFHRTTVILPAVYVVNVVNPVDWLRRLEL